MAKKHGLGRGLGALIKEGTVSKAVATSTGGAGVKKLSISNISKGRFQPRNKFEKEALSELTASIKEHGVLQPLLVRLVDGSYELIAGERRLRASTDAGLKEVPVVVITADGSKAMELALIENLQRENLNIIEEGEGYEVLAKKFNLTQEQIASRISKPRTSIANAMRVLSLPEDVKNHIINGKLSAGHAKILTGIDDQKEKLRFANKVVRDGLSVRGLEALVKGGKKKTKKRKKSDETLPDSHLMHISDKLHTHFGTSVRIKPCGVHANGKKKKGVVEVDFFSPDDLNRLLEIMGVIDYE